MNNLLKPSFYISEIKSALNLLNRHSGSYSDWSEAVSNSQSYQNEKIIDQIKCNKFIPGSYPTWIFSLRNFFNYFKYKYTLKINFNSEEGNFFFSKFRNGVYRGMIWYKD